MEMTLLGGHTRSREFPQRLYTAALCVPLLMAAAGTAWGQRIRINGTVADSGGTPLAGALVRVLGDSGAATSTGSGRFSISAPATGTLTVRLVGYQPFQTAINGQTAISVTLRRRLAVLSEVIVQTSGYGGDAQKRSQITGAVGTVNVAATQNRSQASVVQSLDATVSGVTVTDNGSPGSRSTVRIRGISSFQNNDPLYIVDGTPVQDTYVNFINPEDIESVQVLKDASAASIYGSRASNGVILITTKKGGDNGPPRTTLSVRQGTASPVNGYDNFLSYDPMYYFQVVKTGLINQGLTPAQIQAQLGPLYGDVNNPSIPKYLYAAPNTITATDAYGRATAVNQSLYAYQTGNVIIPASAGTNWWKAVFGSAPVSEVNLGVTGAGTGTQYAVTANYFDQTGTAAFNRYRRGSVRANTQLTRNRWTVGENLAVIGENGYGGVAGDVGSEAEGGFLGKNILMPGIVPVYDVTGNYGGAKSPTLGSNNSNPLQQAYLARNNSTTTDRFFGNVFGSYELTPQISLRTQLGGNVGTTAGRYYAGATPQNLEATYTDSYQDQNTNFTNWTWSNTARYSQQTGKHNVALLLGQEINEGNSRYLQGSVSNLISSNVNSLFVNSGIGTLGNPFSTGGQYALLSFFGKADYTYNDRYVASVTVRRDGSSNLGPNNRWGTFPAAGLAWHASREAFLANNSVISDLQLRVGYGVTGNQQIPTGRTVSQYGSDPGGTSYNITGSGTLAPGYKLVSLGNPNLKWEQDKSINAGFDLGLYNNNLNVIFDYFSRLTNNLLFNPALPASAGTAAQPFVNVGAVKNAGFDFSVGHQGRNWSLNFNGSHYKNRITRIDGQQNFFINGNTYLRSGNVTINQIGQSIGAFYGYVAQGYFRDSADVASSPKQDGAAPGRIKFKDVNGDGSVTLADRTVIGDPNPKFTGGLDGTYRLGHFDLRGTLFGTFGNKIYDAQKYYYVFENFPSASRNDLLQNSWTPTNLNAKYPRIDHSDAYSSAPSSYYVENGSYVRLRNLQLGYTLPATGYRFLPAGTRIYVQAENLFTITGYEGLDPALSPASINPGNDPNLDQRDQFRGVDQGAYPSSRTFSIGITTRF
ncbi:SusC/RagA family TonB-linked outer membrane protein [Gemmatimonadetes bacterium T265]|nr:SusC/RagA family TonB-linked outer membrane protein [Gemmatimonadetes bacterium T265]